MIDSRYRHLAPRAPRRVRATVRLALALLLGGAAAAAAHDVWLMPARFQPAAGERIPIRLFVGEGFQGEALPRNEAGIEGFTMRGPGAETRIAGADGLEPTGVAVVETAGLHLVTYRSRPRRIELPATTFESYLAEEGLDQIVDARRQRGDSDRSAREAYSRCAQTLLAVGDASTGLPEAAGCPFELRLEADPYAVGPSSEIPVAALFRGAPLAGVLIVAMPADAPGAALRQRTGPDGRASFRLDDRGPWLIKAVQMESSDEPGVDWRSWWASITFERQAEAD